jgi:hypothetical protein
MLKRSVGASSLKKLGVSATRRRTASGVKFGSWLDFTRAEASAQLPSLRLADLLTPSGNPSLALCARFLPKH